MGQPVAGVCVCVCVCVMAVSLPAASASVCRIKAEIKRGTCYDFELQVGGHVGCASVAVAIETRPPAACHYYTVAVGRRRPRLDLKKMIRVLCVGVYGSVSHFCTLFLCFPNKQAGKSSHLWR